MGEYKPSFCMTEEIMSLAVKIGESIGAIMVDLGIEVLWPARIIKICFRGSCMSDDYP